MYKKSINKQNGQCLHLLQSRTTAEPKKKERKPPLFLTNFTDLSQLQTIAKHDSDESNCHDVSFYPPINCDPMHRNLQFLIAFFFFFLWRRLT
jgi:hypothetical protein